MARFFRAVALLLSIILTFVVLLVFLLHSYTPVYQFRSPTPFEGRYVYNPYAQTDSTFAPTKWRKGNFHAHTTWDVNGDYTTQEFVDTYRRAGYNIIGIAEHQRLNLELSDRESFIPTYEHGFTMSNFHQTMLGATGVSWYEYPVTWFNAPIQHLTASQMQHLFHILKPQARLIAFNHPERLRMVSDSVFSRLNGYDLWELNPSRDQGAPLWDIALSSGHYAPMIANDDAHSITNRGSWFQRSFTMVGSPTPDAKSILVALRAGRSYGVYIPSEINTFETHHDFPKVIDITFERIITTPDSSRLDTTAQNTVQTTARTGEQVSQDHRLTVTVEGRPQRIDFIGQGGVVRHSVADSSNASYTFAPEDTYIRTEIFYPSGIVLSLNPLARTEDGAYPDPTAAPIFNMWLTLLNMLFCIAVAIGLWFLIKLLWRMLRHPRPRSSDLYRGRNRP